MQLSSSLVVLLTFVAAASSAPITLTLKVYYQPGCPDIPFGNVSSPKTVQFQYNAVPQPSCNEFISFTTGSPTLDYSYHAASTCIQQTDMLLYAQKYDLFSITSSEYYGFPTGNFSGFRVMGCTETASSVGGYLATDQITPELAEQCFFLPGKTNDTTTLSSLENFDVLTFSYTGLNAQVLNITQSPNFDYSFDSSIQSVNGATWSLNKVLSSPSMETVATPTLPPFNLFDPMTSYTFMYTLNNKETTIPERYIAPSMQVVLSQGKIHVSLLRNLTDTPIPMQQISTCNLTYVVGYKSSGRNWGNWFNVEPDTLTSATMDFTDVGVATSVFVAPTRPDMLVKSAYNLANGGCFAKCLKQITVFQPGVDYNPTYSSEFVSPPRRNSRCPDGTVTSPICQTLNIESTYVGSDCLCGAIGGVSFSNTYNRILDKSEDSTLTATVQTSYGSVFVNYTVNSGGAISASVDEEEEEEVASVAGAVTGAVIMTVVFVILFFIFSKPLGGTSKSLGESLSEKTTTPLAGVQLTFVLIGVCCSFASVFSSEHALITFDSGLATASATYSQGVWRGSYTNGLVGIPSTFISTNNVGSFQCESLVIEVNTVSGTDYNYEYVNACYTARASICFALVAGFFALAFALYKRQRLVLPLAIVASLAAMVSAASFKLKIIDEYWIDRLDGIAFVQPGNGFYLSCCVFIVFAVEAICYGIDYLRMEPASE